MQSGREQSIIISDQCVIGDAIHEIGHTHTLWLWHEQSRSDRDDYIRIIPDNIDPKVLGGGCFVFDYLSLLG